MTLQELISQGQANNPTPGGMPSYAAGSLGDTYMKGLMADPTFQANLAAYKDPSNWSPGTNFNGDPTSGPSVYHNPNSTTNNMPGDLVNIPGVGWVNPNTNDPMGALRGGNVWSSPDTTAGAIYHAMGFGPSGNVTENNQLSTERNMSFGQTMLHDVLPLAAFVLGGGALAGAFGGAAAGAGAGAGEAGGAGAGEAGFAGAGIDGMSGAGFSGAGINGMNGVGFTGAGVGGGAAGGFGGAGGGTSTGTDFTAGSGTEFGSAGSGNFGSLGSGFNGLGIDNATFAGGGDMGAFGSLSPSAGGVPSGTFSGGIGSGAGGGLGNTLGSGFNGVDVNGAIDSGTAASQSGLTGLFNQAKSLYNGPIGQTYRGASSLYDLYAANQKAKNAQNMMNSITNNFSQNGAYSQGLQRQLAARDAAAGRNSQYGQRAVDLQQALAQGNANAMMSPAYQGLNSTYNTNKYGGLTSLSKLFGAGTTAASAVPGVASAVGNAASSAGDWLGSLF
jgi:hypothetical protein